MKTRIIRTGIYKDETMLSLTPDMRFICVYLYTNDHISLTNIYKIPVQLIQLETGYDISTIKLTLDRLAIAKVVQHHNYLWVKLLRPDFASLEYKGEKNDIAIEKYISEIPNEVKDFFVSDTSIDTTMDSSYKSEIINKKSKTIIQKSETQEGFDLFWSAYPKKEKKKDSRAIWNKKELESQTADIIAFVENAKNTDRWKKGYIKNPPTFLTGECWEDDLESYGDRKKTLSDVIDFNKK